MSPTSFVVWSQVRFLSFFSLVGSFSEFVGVSATHAIVVFWSVYVLFVEAVIMQPFSAEQGAVEGSSHCSAEIGSLRGFKTAPRCRMHTACGERVVTTGERVVTTQIE